MTGRAAPTHTRISSIRKVLLRTALFLLLVVFLLTTELCHNRLFLFPSTQIKQTPADYRMEFEEVAFENETGKQLAGWFCPAENAIGAVVVNHGNCGNIGDYVNYAQALTQAGVSVLLYDYQGFGHSEGGPSISSLPGDALAAFDYLASRVGGGHKVAVLGVSLGAPISCTVAARRSEAAALILEGAFLLETELYWRMGTLGAPVAFVISKSLSPAVRPERDILALNGRPLLMVHGANDSTTPLFGAAELYEKAPRPKWLWVMDKAGHFPDLMFYRRNGYPKVLAAFLRHVFLDEPFDQPRVSWAAADRGGKWKVSAGVRADTAPVSLVVVTQNNKTVRRESLPAGSYDVSVEVPSRPVTVSVFVEPQVDKAESGPR